MRKVPKKLSFSQLYRRQERKPWDPSNTQRAERLCCHHFPNVPAVRLSGAISVECGKAATPSPDGCMLVYNFSGASMKKLATCFIAVAGLIGTPVLAADMATREPPPPPAPVFSWSGLYIGLNAGGAFDNKVTEEPTGLFSGFAEAPLLATSSNQSAFTGGGQVGYNWQFDNLVAGIEGDFNYVGFRDINFTVTGLPGIPFGSGVSPNVFNYTHPADRFFGTLRARLGYAADRALFYATGGLAFSGRSTPTAAIP
jgi:opacity protein-like surface antigen